MKRILLKTLVVAMLLAVLSACSPGGSETQSSGQCPTPGEDTLLYTMEPQGYCVLYPATHQPFESGEGNTTFAVESLMDVSNPRFSVIVTDAAGEDTAAAADRIEADFGLPEMNTRSEVTLGGEQAVVLDNMPGQDINRRVVVVHDGRLYDLTFIPVGADYGELAQRTEEVYQQVVDTFAFMP